MNTTDIDLQSLKDSNDILDYKTYIEENSNRCDTEYLEIQFPSGKRLIIKGSSLNGETDAFLCWWTQ